MINDIQPYSFFNYYFEATPENDSIVLFFNENGVFCSIENGELRFPFYNEWPEKSADFTYLFSISGTAFFLASTESEISLPKFEISPTQIFRTSSPKHLAFAGITAFQLYKWYSSHKFCGGCGSPTVKSNKERMLYCEKCGQMEYPKISPAVIVGVTNKDKILLTKYAGRSTANYALIAGFTEIGETVEETVKREVMEEVGLHVKNITYYKCQPWSFTDTLLFGFYAELDGEDSIHLDAEELATAVWLSKDEIETNFDDISLTNEMICNFSGKYPPILS